MTGRRARLARLEDRRREDAPGDVLGIFAADAGAGVWREKEGGQGRTLPLSPEDQTAADGLASTGGALLMYAPVGGAKFIDGRAL